MEAAPPTYEKATLVDYWDIIARYVPSRDLCSAALVCSRWHETFAPHIWGNPASHFGVENDAVFVALARFRLVLQTARPYVRSLTHTLYLQAAHTELYNGPHADWLRDILKRLPNLQSLIVRGLPIFDHSALQALKDKQPQQTSGSDSTTRAIELPGSLGFAFHRTPREFIPSFNLRLLDASRCSNVTSGSLAQALDRFEALLYLDLSFVQPARDNTVLRALRRFSGLQVLKLRGIGLADESVTVLASAIARRVRSLDIRDNYITDRGVRTLLDECFLVEGCDAHGVASGQRSPALLPYMGAEMLDIYQGEDFEGYLRKTLTEGFVSRLTIEDAPEGGITHLYLANNEVSVEGISGLLRSRRLHVLDVQSAVGGLARARSPGAVSDGKVNMRLPGVEKLTPVISTCSPDGLKFLRIDHSLITTDVRGSFTEQVVKGRVELGNTSLPDLPRYASELHSSATQPNAYEMPTTTTPKRELPGVCSPFVSPVMNDTQHTLENDPPSNRPRRGSGAFAPEAVGNPFAETDHMSLVSPVSATGESTQISEKSTAGLGSLRSSNAPSSFDWIQPPPLPPSRSFCSAENERKIRLNAHVATNHNLHPAMLPHLRTLVLTHVPPISGSQDVADRLICFVKHCAEEAFLAKQHAKQDYSLPPGRREHAAALKYSANQIFGLQRLVLELAPEQNTGQRPRTNTWQSFNSKSVTEDRDSEVYWSASETDFSFFGDEELSLPTLDAGHFAHGFGSDGKEVSFGNANSPVGSNSHDKAPVQVKYDTVALLSAFRKERKLVHERQLAAGAIDTETEGFWEGMIQVVRPGAGLRNDEELDYYGNRFEHGWLYR